jgi:hypothetical protein
MPVIMRCVQCQRKLRVLDRLIGKLVKCPACQLKFVAEAAMAATAAVPAGAAAKGGPAVPRTPPPLRAPAGPHAIEAGPPLEDIQIEPQEDGITRPLAPTVPAPLEEARPPARHLAPAGPRPSSFFAVFVALGGILLLTTAVGLACAWWINSSVQMLGPRVLPTDHPQNKGAPAGEPQKGARQRK